MEKELKKNSELNLKYTDNGEKNASDKMPSSKKRYGSRKKYLKFKRCIRELKKRKKGLNPYAVCHKSIFK